MIVVDSSAIVAIMMAEATMPVLRARLAAEPSCLISAANYVEAGQVLAQRFMRETSIILAEFHELLDSSAIAIAPVDEAQARVALQARIRYGRGFGHPARLNYSDCFAYALAKVRGLPLLYVGDDFIHTDIVSALA